MPNLLPDWTLTLPFALGQWNVRAAGRLSLATLLLIVGMTFVVTLIKPPALKRPFPTALGIALFPVLIVGGLVLGKVLIDYQRTIVWLTIAAVVAHALLMVASRQPRDPERKATWVECMTGAVAVFALFALGYAIIPSEWLTFANAKLGWGDSTKFVFTSHEHILGLINVNYPFNLDFPAMRDIVVSVIYGVMLTTNLKLWVMWQKRLEVKPAPAEGEATPLKRSRFGRPLRRAERTPVAASVEGA
jgi:hypothetical protein